MFRVCFQPLQILGGHENCRVTKAAGAQSTDNQNTISFGNRFDVVIFAKVGTVNISAITIALVMAETAPVQEGTGPYDCAFLKASVLSDKESSFCKCNSVHHLLSSGITTSLLLNVIFMVMSLKAAIAPRLFRMLVILPRYVLVKS